MKFTDKRIITKERFKDIEIGECFITPSDGHVNMRMAIKYYNADNVVDLITGKQYCFDDDKEVIPVTAEVVVTN